MASKKTNNYERALFGLGERLSMPVYKIKEEMPLYEFLGWLRYFNQDDEEEPIDLTEATPDDLERMFG